MNQLQQLFNAFLGMPVNRPVRLSHRCDPHATDWSRFDCPAYLRRQALTSGLNSSLSRNIHRND